MNPQPHQTARPICCGGAPDHYQTCLNFGQPEAPSSPRPKPLFAMIGRGA